jgi:methyl-accepting chemotaxis protein
MADNKQTSSQTHNSNGNGSIPHFPALDGMKKAMDEQMQRFHAMSDEMAKLEQKGIEQARQAVDEAAKLTKETLAYASQIAGEWRKLALEAARRTAELFNAKA